jgi:phage tail protein X
MRVYGVATEQAVLALRHANRSLVQGLRQFTLPAGALITVPVITLENLQEAQTVEVAPWQR